MKKLKGFALSLLMILIIIGCKEDTPEPGKINLYFEELADDSSLKTDTLIYVNEAGNHYMITEVQYFISDLELKYQDGRSYFIQYDKGIHYRDFDLEETRAWMIDDDIPAGIIDTLIFTFGLDDTTNLSGLFLNPPESNMFWPEQLGGGYHYMKMNGKWLDPENNLKPLNFHLGIGQTYDTTGQVTGFVQNYFKVKLSMPVYSSYIIKIDPGDTTNLMLIMRIESWFKTPHTWDFNTWGGMMMQNLDAMRTACENGKDAFFIQPLFEI
jgi:hypothetical protein